MRRVHCRLQPLAPSVQIEMSQAQRLSSMLYFSLGDTVVDQRVYSPFFYASQNSSVYQNSKRWTSSGGYREAVIHIGHMMILLSLRSEFDDCEGQVILHFACGGKRRE